MLTPDPAPHAQSADSTAEIARLRAERATAIEALHAAVRDTTRLMRLFAILNEAAPPAEMLDRVLATLSELFMADVVVLLEAAGDVGFRPLAALGLPLGTTRWPPPASGAGHAADVLRSGVPRVSQQARQDPEIDPCLRDLDVETAVWLPVAGDQPTRRGVLVLGRCRALAISRGDVDLLQAMAYRIGVMMDREHEAQERRRLELQVQRDQKAESLARMAGAIAHHFNNMLAGVIGSLEIALQDLPAGYRCRADIVRAEEAARRAAEVSGLLLAYLGQGPVTRAVTDIGQLVAMTARRFEASFPANVGLQTEIDPGPLVASVNAAQIAQAVGNLLMNATESIDQRAGQIRMTVFRAAAASVPRTGPLAADWQPKASAYICVEIADNGGGMKPESIEQIFDPFFTSKSVGRGLGLPVVLGIVRAHDGLISVQSAVDAGTTVRFYLPGIETPVPAAAPARATAQAPAPAGRSRRVLVVDDEEIVRRTAELMLAKLGYEVVTAVDGADGVERFRQIHDALGFVVLDLTMPRMNGWATLEAVRAIHPGIPAILMSGYDEARALGSHAASQSPTFLHKPFTFGELEAAIDKLA